MSDLCLLPLLIANVSPAGEQDAERVILRDRIDMLVTNLETTIDRTPIAAVILIDHGEGRLADRGPRSGAAIERQQGPCRAAATTAPRDRRTR